MATAVVGATWWMRATVGSGDARGDRRRGCGGCRSRPWLRGARSARRRIGRHDGHYGRRHRQRGVGRLRRRRSTEEQRRDGGGRRNSSAEGARQRRVVKTREELRPQPTSEGGVVGIVRAGGEAAAVERHSKARRGRRREASAVGEAGGGGAGEAAARGDCRRGALVQWCPRTGGGLDGGGAMVHLW